MAIEYSFTPGDVVYNGVPQPGNLSSIDRVKMVTIAEHTGTEWKLVALVLPDQPAGS